MKKFIQKIANCLGYQIKKNAPTVNSDINLYYELFDHQSVENKRFFNIGAGSFKHEAWTNVDNESEWYQDKQGKNLGISWDLLSIVNLPIDNNSAEIVYTSHTIEHVHDDAAQNFFNESFRILKPNSILRVTAPNIDLAYRAFTQNDRNYFYWANWYSDKESYEKIKLNSPLNKASIGQLFLWHFASSASTLHADGATERITDEMLYEIFQNSSYEETLNFCTSKCSLRVQKKYPGHHINWWNKDKVIKMLKIAGYQQIFLSGYGQSFSPVLRNTIFFDNTHPKISLYIEAIK